MRQKNFDNSGNDWKIIQYKKIKVYYLASLDGGGMYFVQDYLTFVKNAFGKVNKLCEFASGPGFIGFSLLANGFCRRLSLIDVNPLAIKCCLQTVKANGLGKVVKTYVSNGLDNIPKGEKWDLVVGNPPHFSGTLKMYDHDMIKVDPGWKIHQKFYKDISRHLSGDGSVLFVENYKGSNPQIFERMIGKYGLVLVKTFNQRRKFFKSMKNLMSIILSLSVENIKRYQSSYKKNRESTTNYQKLTHLIHPHYFVWSKKLAAR